MKLKKLLSILLTLCMLLSAMPLTVFAEDCAHEYDYDCSNNCNICGEYIRYEAECVEGEPEVADTYSLQHQLYYNCTYCNELMFSRWESHNDNDGDGACDVCGYELHVHTYNYDCSTSCNGCSETTRPEAGHVDNAVVTDIREDKHSITYYCLYCNKYLREDHYAPHVDDDGDRICDACGGTVAVYTVTYYEYDGEQDYYYDNGTAEVLAGESVTLGAQYSYWYKGIGWATEPYGELVYAAGDTFTPTGDTALYSVVEPFTATVDLGAEDAVYRDADGNPITAIQGEMPYSLATVTVFPTRVGYVFAGFVDGDGYEYGLYQDEETGEWYVEVSMWQDITVTALWELCTDHEYVYDCYTGCKLCGKYSRPEAEHVKGEPEVYEIAVDYHGAKYYCVYCGCLLQTGLVSHEDNDGDDICDVCGYGACAHEYDYECSNNCNICGEYTRPEVGCVKGDPEVYAIEVDSHAADYYCIYCGEICQSGFVPHEDNDGIIGCDVCGYGACTHEYDYDCSTNCNVCGETTRPEAACVKGAPEIYYILTDSHAARYYCIYCGVRIQIGTEPHVDDDGDGICDVCGGYDHPEGDHVEGEPEVSNDSLSHLLTYYCRYCSKYMRNDPAESHYDNDADSACDVCGYAVCAHEYAYDCSTNCNVCGKTTRPEPNADHTYAYDCATNCSLCGKTARPEPDADHTYAYECSGVCNVCYGYTRPEAKCVKGDPTYWIGSNNHEALYYCIYCNGFLGQGTSEPHADNDADGACDVCGAGADCEHEYDYDCSKSCNLCDYKLRPDADHVTKVDYYTDSFDHKARYYCIYCESFRGEDPWEPHYDNDGIIGCDVCGYGGCAHEYNYDCSTECNICGQTTRPEAQHAYDYDCSSACNICGEITRPEAEHVEGDPRTYRSLVDEHGYTVNCVYCDVYLRNGWEPHYDNDADRVCDACGYAICAHEYDYDCSAYCNICYEYTRPEAECVEGKPTAKYIYKEEHQLSYYCIYCDGLVYVAPFEPHYDNDADDICDACGYEIPAECAHEYDYDCSKRCNVCDALTRTEAEHVKGDPTYWTSEDEHLAYYYCIYCNAFLDQGTFEPHADSDADGACDACGAGADCAHQYDYDCSKYCNVCGYKLRPEAECVEGETGYYTYVEEYHAVYVYCAYCDDYVRAYGESHYDDDTDGACDACNSCFNGHQYAHEYDEQCDVCGTYRDVAFPLTAHGVSVSEDVNGLAMAFTLQADGLQFNGTKIDYTNATIGVYKLITAGAVVSNNYETTGIIPTLDDVDNYNVLDISAVYAYHYDEATGTLYYAIRITNIPDEGKDTMVVFTPYIILEDEDGNQFTYYPSAWYAIYNEVANG